MSLAYLAAFYYKTKDKIETILARNSKINK